jgi:hypothetical protein
MTRRPTGELRGILTWIAFWRVYISNAMIDGKFALRACIVNHHSTEEDVKSVVNEVLDTGGELAGNYGNA